MPLSAIVGKKSWSTESTRTAAIANVSHYCIRRNVEENILSCQCHQRVNSNSVARRYGDHRPELVKAASHHQRLAETVSMFLRWRPGSRHQTTGGRWPTVGQLQKEKRQITRRVRSTTAGTWCSAERASPARSRASPNKRQREYESQPRLRRFIGEYQFLPATKQLHSFSCR